MTWSVAGDEERLRRWRLILGEAADGTGVTLDGDDRRVDAALGALYDAAGSQRGSRRRGGLGSSAPGVARWLGDIRRFFPTSVVRVIQRDAIERLDLQRLLLEPEMLAAVEPDLALVTTLLELHRLLPDTTRAVARQVVARLVADIERRLATRTRQAVSGAISRASRTRRPKLRDVDWDRTIRANLAHYQPEYRTVVPQRLIGYGRARAGIDHEVIIAIDQSASMADSVVYASVLACALASLPTLHTSVVAFDTNVVDLTDMVHDPVEVLFGVQLGGGTDIDRALAYCEGLITQPTRTVLILVSDLYEGGIRDGLVGRMAELSRRGVNCIVLLALSDDGAPSYDHDQAAALAGVGVAALACTPDRFGELIAAGVERRDLARWAAEHNLTTVAPLGSP